MIHMDKQQQSTDAVTNFTFYKTLDEAIKAYTNEKMEYVYNVHEGVSAGRFLKWLYEPHVCRTGMGIRGDDNPEKVETISDSETSSVESQDKSKYCSTSPLSNGYDCCKESLDKDKQSYTDCKKLHSEACSMAKTLRKIEGEISECARYNGDGTYSTDELLKKLCVILYASYGYHRWKKYCGPDNGCDCAKEDRGNG